jgi:hypothetical protein
VPAQPPAVLVRQARAAQPRAHRREHQADAARCLGPAVARHRHAGRLERLEEGRHDHAVEVLAEERDLDRHAGHERRHGTPARRERARQQTRRQARVRRPRRPGRAAHALARRVDVRDRRVEHLVGQRALGVRRLELLARRERVARHEQHVHARLQDVDRTLGVAAEAAHVERVGDHEAAVAQPVAQQLEHHRGRARRRAAGHRVEGRHLEVPDHDPAHVLGDERAEGHEVDRVQLLAAGRDAGQLVVAVLHRAPVPGEVLGHRKHAAVAQPRPRRPRRGPRRGAGRRRRSASR